MSYVLTKLTHNMHSTSERIPSKIKYNHRKLCKWRVPLNTFYCQTVLAFYDQAGAMSIFTNRGQTVIAYRLNCIFSQTYTEIVMEKCFAFVPSTLGGSLSSWSSVPQDLGESSSFRLPALCSSGLESKEKSHKLTVNEQKKEEEKERMP